MNLAQNVCLDDFKVMYSFLFSDSLKFFHLGQFLSNYWSYRVIFGTFVLVKCLCLGQFLSNYCSYSQWYLVHVYILAWPLECSHPYLTLTFIHFELWSECLPWSVLDQANILAFLGHTCQCGGGNWSTWVKKTTMDRRPLPCCMPALGIEPGGISDMQETYLYAVQTPFFFNWKKHIWSYGTSTEVGCLHNRSRST